MQRFKPSAKLRAINIGITIEVVLIVHYLTMLSDSQLYGITGLFEPYMQILMLIGCALLTQIILRDIEVYWLTQMFKRNKSLLYKHCTRVRTFSTAHAMRESAKRTGILTADTSELSVLILSDKILTKNWSMKGSILRRIWRRSNCSWGELFYVSTGAGTGVFIVEHYNYIDTL